MLLCTILFGIIIGSFLTVCIYRIPYGREKGPPRWDEEESDIVEPEPEPQKKLTIVSPKRSICPQCEKQLLWYHNIPLFSWILLRGKCGFCKTPIPVRYPMVEALSGFFCGLSYYMYGLTLTGAFIYLFCCALIVISFIDIDYYIIPDVISLPGIVVGLLIGTTNHLLPGTFLPPVAQGAWGSLIGLLVGGGVLLFISEAYYRLRGRIGLGMGDVKLLGMTGACFGAEGAIFSMFVGSLVGSVFGLLFIVVFRKKLTHQLPFGPYLALGTLIYLFASRHTAFFMRY